MSVEQLSHLLLAVEQFSQVAGEQGARLVTLAEQTSQQTERLIRLTRWIIGLTILLGAIAVLQLWAMLSWLEGLKATVHRVTVKEEETR